MWRSIESGSYRARLRRFLLRSHNDFRRRLSHAFKRCLRSSLPAAACPQQLARGSLLCVALTDVPEPSLVDAENQKTLKEVERAKIEAAKAEAKQRAQQELDATLRESKAKIAAELQEHHKEELEQKQLHFKKATARRMLLGTTLNTQGRCSAADSSPQPSAAEMLCMSAPVGRRSWRARCSRPWTS